MTAQLGQTGDLTHLVPGDVGAVADTMWAMRSYGDSLHEAGAGLGRIDTSSGWSGQAAEQFRSAFHGQPGRWLDAGDAFHHAADALDAYATALRDAQRQAGDAIAMWDDGEQATRTAVDAYSREVDQANQHNAQGGPPADVPPFQDPGEARRQAAQRLLDQARGAVDSAGDAAAQAVRAATEKAPHKPGFWSKVGHFFSAAGRDIESVGAHALNGLASFGNAMVNHPGDTAALIGGTFLAGIGAAGDGVGTVLAATGVGAPIGVPLDVVSTAAVVTGGTMMAASAGDLIRHAATDDHVSPADAGGDEPTAPEGKAGTKTDRLKEHLTDRDLDAARRELNGETVATKPDGTPWDHVDEVRNAQRGLVNRIDQLQRLLGDSRISDAERAAVQAELSEASRLLDYSEGFVPRS